MPLLRLVCAAWILPIGFSLIAFYGFFTNYTTDVFSLEGITARYDGSIFKYRVLGRALVETVAAVFEHLPIGWAEPRALRLFDPVASPATYWAYAAVHAVSTAVGCTLLLVTLRRCSARQGAELVVVAVSMLMALAAFVVTPYDGLFFALQMAAVGLIVAWPPERLVAPLAVVTLLAALTRETAYFVPAFVLAVQHTRIRSGDRQSRLAFVVSVAIVVLTYVGLRVALGSAGGRVYYAWQAAENLKWASLVGTVMLAAALVLLTGRGPNRSARLWYVGLAAPYVVFVHLFAEPWEWRLWIPVIVPLVVLSFVDQLPDGRRAAQVR